RPLSLPLVLMVAEADGIEPWAHVDERAGRYMRRWWPGPLTLVLNAREGVRPPLASAAEPPTLAVRIPDHEVALTLLHEVGEAQGAGDLADGQPWREVRPAAGADRGQLPGAPQFSAGHQA